MTAPAIDVFDGKGNIRDGLGGYSGDASEWDIKRIEMNRIARRWWYKTNYTHRYDKGRMESWTASLGSFYF